MTDDVHESLSDAAQSNLGSGGHADDPARLRSDRPDGEGADGRDGPPADGAVDPTPTVEGVVDDPRNKGGSVEQEDCNGAAGGPGARPAILANDVAAPDFPGLLLPEGPTIVRLVEVAIAAGAAGEQVVLNFVEFPGPELAAIWGCAAGRLDEAQCVSIRDAKDLSRAVAAITDLRLVAIHNPKLVAQATSRLGGDPVSFCHHGPLPAIVCANAGDLDDNQSAVVSIHASDGEMRRCMDWVRRGGNPTVEFPSDLSVSVIFPKALEDLVWPNDAQGLRCLRDCRVLQALLGGFAFLRLRPWLDALNFFPVTLDDYRLARQLLCDPLLRAGDDPYDRLAVAMVGRANAFLRMRFAEVTTARPSGRNEGLVATLSEMDRGVTRADMVDLGQCRGRVVQNLLEFVRSDPNGRELFDTIGLERGASDQEWASETPSRLARRLIRWSPKQVRTRFDRLVRDGLVQQRRPAGNASIVYILPACMHGASAFSQLPSPEQLMTRLDDGQ